MDPRRRGALQLGMARRLAGVPELFAAAAEQYLPVTDSVDDPPSGIRWWGCCGAPPTRRR